MRHFTWIFVRVCLMLALLSAAITHGPVAQAQSSDVPPYLVHQGRLMDALNAPITGTQDLTFNLYAEETGGTSFWTETQTVLLTEGFYSVTLGQGQALDLSQFDGATLYLGVTVAGEELAPRMALRSVPYAIKSGTSQNAMTADTAVNVTGDITPNSVTVGNTVIDSSGITINGATVIDGSGQWAGPAPVADYDTILNPPFTFDNLNCANGDVAQFVGGVWSCTPASSADTLSGLGCLEGQTAKFIAGAWSCADDIDTDTDTDTTYTAGAGITIGAANDIAADTTLLQARVVGTCLPGESINTINADGSVVCEPDTDTNTTYSADPAGGLVLSGANAFGIAANAIDSSRIADGAVTSADIADGTIASADIADGTITSTDILNGTIANTDLAADSVTSANITNGTIANADLAAGSVNSATIADGTVTTTDITDGTVASVDIANGTIGSADINTAEVQRRVAGVCAAGSSVGTINVDGTVTCDATISNQSAIPQAASFNINGSGALNDLTIANQINARATWGLNAKTQGLMIMPEGEIRQNGGTLTFTSTVIVMNPASGSYFRVAAGNYNLAAWGYLYVDMPPTGTRGTTITPTVGTWIDTDRPYDNSNRIVLAQRASGGPIFLNFSVPAVEVTPRSSLVTIVTGLVDFRLNSGNSTAGAWVDVTGRSLSFTQRHSGSAIKITYQDTLGTLGRYYAGCEWRILVDGNQVAFFSAADEDTDSAGVVWKMENSAHVAWVTGLTPGAHTVLVQNRGNRGAWGGGTSECLSGWNQVGSFLSAEEIP